MINLSISISTAISHIPYRQKNKGTHSKILKILVILGVLGSMLKNPIISQNLDILLVILYMAIAKRYYFLKRSNIIPSKELIYYIKPVL